MAKNKRIASRMGASGGYYSNILNKEFGKSVGVWIIALTLIFMSATFEHSFWSLKNFVDKDLIHWGLKIPLWTMFMLVIGLDAMIWFSNWFIPQANVRNMDKGIPTALLIGSTAISIQLNVNYMVTNMPGGWEAFGYTFNTSIALSVGTMIPLALAMLGYMHGNVLVKDQAFRQKAELKKEEKAIQDKLRREELAQKRKLSKQANTAKDDTTQVVVDNKKDEDKAVKA